MKMGGEVRTQLPPLREDLALHPGLSARNGSPAWVLHDPGRNRFFQIDALGFEILSRWTLGAPDAVAASVTDETTLHAEAADVMEMARFLVIHELVQVRGEEGRSRLNAATSKGRWPKLTWLLHNYLYLRVHLLNPEKFLIQTYPYVRWIYSQTMLKVMLLVAVAGLWLAGRQWDAFTHGLSYFFSFQGVILFGLSMFISKVVHELGHGYTAYRYGCRVSSMGVVFIVLTPVFYTDASEAWLLTSRNKRMAIGMAGIMAELGLAAFSTLAWSFLPDGALRSAALMLATTSWVHTLFVNMLPYMRFDGYYLFSDWLGIANLFDRSFAMGRWWVRELLFGLGDPPPEEWDLRTERLLIVFALGVWIYRLILFIGIAFLVYHFVFKLLGILLFFVEISWFVLLPIWREFQQWYALRERLEWTRHTKVSVVAVSMLLLVVVLPLSFSVDAPALLRPAEHVVFYAPRDAKVLALPVRQGDRVTLGGLLLKLDSPELAFRMKQAARQVEQMHWQIAASAADEQLYAQRLVAKRELESADRALSGYRKQSEALVAVAPFSGRVERVARDLKQGQWVGGGSPLVSLTGSAGTTGEGYLFEADLERVSVGARCTFYPESPDFGVVHGRVTMVESVGTRVLQRPELSSIYSGPIPSRLLESGDVVPEKAVYRMFWKPDGTKGWKVRQLRGTLVVTSSPESILWRFWRTATGVFIREAGF